MKTKKLLTLFTIFYLFWAGNICYGQTAEELFPQAVQLEEVKGELEEAIKIYETIVKDYPEERETAAKAQLHIGLCYEKLGKTEAINAYESILENFSEQKEQVSIAQSRLAELKTDNSKGLVVEKTLFNIQEPFGFSPDGKMIVGVNYDDVQTNIVVSHLENDKVDYITNYLTPNLEGGNHWAYTPVWSPDGKQIAFTEMFGNRNIGNMFSIGISDLAGNTRNLLNNELYYYIPNDWLPDGKSILTFRTKRSNPPDPAQDHIELGLVSISEENFMPLVKLNRKPRQAQDMQKVEATVSPDGKFIVYTDIVSEENNDLFIVSSDGKESWPLIIHPATEKFPRWSPDGKNIIFMSNRLGSWALWGIDVENGKSAGDPFLITEVMGDSFIGNWTMHGLLSWNDLVMYELYLLDVDPKTGEPTGKPEQMTYTPSGFNQSPTFSPEGDRIAFIREDLNSGKDFLVITQINGDNAVECDIPQNYQRLRTIHWMPDGEGIGIDFQRNGVEECWVFHINSKTWESIPHPVRPIWSAFDFSGNAFYYLSNEVPSGIVKYDLVSGAQELIYQPEGDSRAFFNSIRCSKDNSKLAFTSDAKLMLIDLESGKYEEVCDSSSLLFSWSPDGEKLMGNGKLMSTGLDKSLYLFSVSGGAPIEYELSSYLPEESMILSLDWSADGSKVVFCLRQDISENLIYKNLIPK